MWFLTQHSWETSTWVENTTEAVSSSNENKNFTINYNKVKEKLWTNWYDSFTYLVDQINSTKNDKLKKESKEVLKSILKETDSIKMSELALWLQKIVNKYEEKKAEFVSEASDENRWILDSIKSFFLDSKTLNEIEEITIDWKVDSIQEFNNKLIKLIKVLNKDSEFSKLPENQRNKIIEWLKNIWSWLEKEKNKTLDFLDKKINNIAKQIEEQEDNWSISIKIEWVDITDFKSKKEAFAFVKLLKEEAEDEFQTLLADFWDFFWKALWEIFTSELPFKPYIYTKNSIKDWIENYQDNDHWSLLVIDWIQVLALTFASINYTETIYRRLITDSLGKTWVKKGFTLKTVKILNKDWTETWETKRVRKTIRIPDYDLSDTNYFSPNTEDVELRNEYKQRVTTIGRLEQQLETIKNPKDKIAFAKELENLKSYLNINTNTFWLKAYSLNKEQGKFKRFLNIFINWPDGLPTWIHLRDSATRNILLDKKSKIKLEEWIDFVFKNASINFDNKTGQIDWIDEKGETDNIKNIRNYINNISDTQRRINILDTFEKYIESLKNNPKSKDVIQNDINNIIENNYLTKDKVIKLIEKKYFKELKEPIERWDGFVNWIKEIWDDIVFKKDNFKKAVSEVWWKLAPASFTYKTAMAIKLKQIVENWNWQWNEEDLKTIFDRIDNWKLEINQIYPWKKAKFKIIVDSLKWLVWKYWIQLPTLHKLNNLWEKWGDLEDIIKQWKEILKELNNAKEIFNDKSELKKNIKNIFELDSTNFSSEASSDYWSEWKEEYFKNMFNDLEDYSKTDNFNLSQEQVKLEIVKMSKWYLTNQKILSLLNLWLKEEELKKDNVKDFIKKVETWKMIITLDELNSYISDLKSWSTIPEKIISFNIPDEISRINTEWKKLGDIHFNNPKFWIFDNNKNFLQDQFTKNELNLAKILNFEAIINDTIDIDWDFSIFMQDANKNWYTSVEFFEKLNQSLNIGITYNEKTIRTNYINKLNNNVSTFFDWLDDLKKKKLINFIENNNIDKSILPKNIKDTLDLDSKSWDFKRQKAEIERFKWKIENSNDLEKLEENFDKYIIDEKIDRDSTEFKGIIDNFNSEIKGKKTEIKESKKSSEKITFSPEEKIKKINNLFDRAILQAELAWDFEKAEDLINIKNNIDPSKSLQTFQRNIKGELGINRIWELKEIGELNKEKTKIINWMRSNNLLDDSNNYIKWTIEWIKEDDRVLNLLKRDKKLEWFKYIKKAFKTWM